ncbi:CoA ester lyase [Rhodococcus sp. 06-156-3C]|uniref:HpcH/HpaI aldolase/citrate lyase family protein n=1 Tax=Nocardiaceae TaxID=85025 RepID=UPI0009B8CC7E|nr:MULTISPECIES: CoA ester lyase [Rhodococcus]OZD11623.1 CoA ester lyase [Rhodococcus sp. 06-156-4C]OZD15465.1 CoA ester lyase [Rhodococcus sp. 06-156-4a]OZD23631.1 CoA ester lyase [Rhodococcus sp. 06-156-3C]OZD27297.1 CoA ester lyase [Rhodococcus sp. 06-156-3b]OZD31307.1 CoA ester lyase [Rhodococcus sp. 06-156-3]
MAPYSDCLDEARRIIESARSFLFVPASRPDRVAKAHSTAADVVIIDLEDAVAPADKEAALRAAVEWLSAIRHGPLSMVRVNPPGSPWHDAEIASLSQLGTPLMIPKSEAAEWLGSLHREAGVPLVPLIETPRGVLRAESIADTDGVVRLALGHIDLAAALAVAPDCYDAFRNARSELVLASAAAGLASPVDGVTTSVGDLGRLVEDIAHASSLGFGGKLCIHPRQVDVVHDALRPSDTELAWARKVIAVVDADKSVSGTGAIAVDGEMIDPPVVVRARAIAARSL